MTQAVATPFRELFRAAQHRQNLCILAVLTWVASCDGRIAPREEQLLRAIASSLDGFGELSEVIAAVKPGREEDLELACRHVRNHLDRGGKRLLAQLAITMAVEDGYLTVGENHVLQFLADLLGLSARRFAKLFEQVTHRPFPRAGDPSSPQWWALREAGVRPSPSKAEWLRDDDAPDEDDEPEEMTRSVALRVLGLDEGAGPDAIHRAYRRLAKTRHPDRFAKLGGAAVAAATAAFERVHEAYQVLTTSSPAVP